MWVGSSASPRGGGAFKRGLYLEEVHSAQHFRDKYGYTMGSSWPFQMLSDRPNRKGRDWCLRHHDNIRNCSHFDLLVPAKQTKSERRSTMDSAPRDALEFPESDRTFLEPQLPPRDGSTPRPDMPFTTLTFATSLDSSLALSPGARTVLSGPQSKAMTHYLRSRHDGILIGVGTAVADDPGLNCRIVGTGGYGGEGLDGQPRPIVIDPSARWDFSDDSKLFQLCRQGRGRAPWIVTAHREPPAEKQALLERYGGRFISLRMVSSDLGQRQADWNDLLLTLRSNGLRSVMIEGGGHVINSLLETPYMSLIDRVIVTIAPTWLGQGGVVVSPARRFDEEGKAISAARLTNIKWYPFGEDVVLCGQIKVHDMQ